MNSDFDNCFARLELETEFYANGETQFKWCKGKYNLKATVNGHFKMGCHRNGPRNGNVKHIVGRS